jgi:hypothetical protein
VRARSLRVFCALGLLAGVFGGVIAATGPTAGANPVLGTTPSYCARYGAEVVAWTETSPNLPVCGPGPDDGGSWASVEIPGPYGASGYFFNATTGFQCVELAERYLAVTDGLAPVLANGQQVAANYHAAYPNTQLYVNGSRGSIGHPPVAGDVISFSNAPGFDAYSDGHVAIVSRSEVDRLTGNGTVTIAQENVAAGYWIYRLSLDHWRLVDSTASPDALWGFAYAEWLHVTPYRLAELGRAVSLFAPIDPEMAIEPLSSLGVRLTAGPALFGRGSTVRAQASEPVARSLSRSAAWKSRSSRRADSPPRSRAASRARLAASRASAQAGS